MIKIALIEDEEKDRNTIKSYLKRYEEEKSVSFAVTEFFNAVTFLTDYAPVYDVVFIDIQMPHMNGMEAVERLRKIDESVPVVFITNMSNYAIRGYSVDAIDFMVKPVVYCNFSVMLDKVSRILKRQTDEIILQTPTDMRRLAVSDIIFVEVIGHKVIYHTEKEEIEIWKSLREQEAKLLPFGFARCNNYCLVNLKYVDKISGNTLTIGGRTQTITRTKKEEFMKKLVAYWGNNF